MKRAKPFNFKKFNDWDYKEKDQWVKWVRQFAKKFIKKELED